MNEMKNARIVSTSLGVAMSDHGVLSFYIHLDYGAAGQGFGGITLDTVNPDREKPGQPTRIPTTLAANLLLGIDTVFGCDWEKLSGTPCRAYGDWGKVLAIGHYLEDKWLWLDETPAFVVTPFADLYEHAKVPA